MKRRNPKTSKLDYGHTPLSERELEFLPKEQFEALYVGTGHEAALPITPKALEILKKHGAVILPTPEVIEKIEKEQRPFIALIHVTC